MNNTDKKENDKDMMTIQEVLDYLKISRTTLHRIRKENLLKGYKVRGSVRFRRADVEEYLENQKEK